MVEPSVAKFGGCPLPLPSQRQRTRQNRKPLAGSGLSMALMRAQGRSISFDPNLRPTLWATSKLMRKTINDLAARADWVLPGLAEGRFLTGSKDLRVLPGLTGSAAPVWYWSNSAIKALITTVRPQPAAIHRFFRRLNWWTPQARKTALSYPSLLPSLKGWLCLKLPRVAPGQGLVPCTHLGAVMACPLLTNCSKPGYYPPAASSHGPWRRLHLPGVGWAADRLNGLGWRQVGIGGHIGLYSFSWQIGLMSAQSV